MKGAMMRQRYLAIALIGAATFLSGCSGLDRPIASNRDRGFDAKDLSQLQAAIYVDPDGCHIWMIDDGAEGYWSRCRDPVSGLPVCTAFAPPNSVVGDYATGGVVPDTRSAGLF
jgi:hypothetical protein